MTSSKLNTWPWLFLCTALLYGTASSQRVDDALKLRGGKLTISRQLDTRSGNSGYSDTELTFFSSCKQNFLGNSVWQEGMISDNFYANSLEQFCSEYPSSDFCPGGSFMTLSRDLRNAFFETACEENDPLLAQGDCISRLESLVRQNINIGYPVSNEIATEVQMSVQGMCLRLIPHMHGTSSTGDQDPPVTGTDNSSGGDQSSGGDSPSGDGNSDVSDGQDPGEQNQGTDGSDGSDGTDGKNQDTDSGTDAKESSEDSTVGELDLTGVDGEGAPGNNGQQAQGTKASPRGPFIGIAATATACLLLFVYVARRRHQEGVDQEKPVHHIGREGDDSFGDDTELNTGSSPSEGRARSLSDVSSSDASASATDHLMSYDEEECTHVKLQEPEPSSPPEKVGAPNVDNGTGPLSLVGSAINSANWDQVYRLASLLAEQDDHASVSSSPKLNKMGNSSRARLHLSEEDQQRAKALDALVEMGDWTGVAVTAALYAGESGYSGTTKDVSLDIVPLSTDEDSFGYMPSPSLVEAKLAALKDSMDLAANSGDWDQVLRLSSEVEQVSMPTGAPSRQLAIPQQQSDEFSQFEAELERAVSDSDWATVSFYADKIREVNPPTGKAISLAPSDALVRVSPGRSIPSVSTMDSAGSDVSKKQTIQKLVEAGKWKGASIMAGLYEMESRRSTEHFEE